ncbi:MAG: hypothetical protein JSR80_07345 [Verrucomicrobia bacterium]|nr:hypothetical protein [Verrucomicrobiota bacterium]
MVEFNQKSQVIQDLETQVSKIKQNLESWAAIETNASSSVVTRVFHRITYSISIWWNLRDLEKQINGCEMQLKAEKIDVEDLISNTVDSIISPNDLTLVTSQQLAETLKERDKLLTVEVEQPEKIGAIYKKRLARFKEDVTKLSFDSLRNLLSDEFKKSLQIEKNKIQESIEQNTKNQKQVVADKEIALKKKSAIEISKKEIAQKIYENNEKIKTIKNNSDEEDKNIEKQFQVVKKYIENCIGQSLLQQINDNDLKLILSAVTVKDGQEISKHIKNMCLAKLDVITNTEKEHITSIVLKKRDLAQIVVENIDNLKTLFEKVAKAKDPWASTLTFSPLYTPTIETDLVPYKNNYSKEKMGLLNAIQRIYNYHKKTREKEEAIANNLIDNYNGLYFTDVLCKNYNLLLGGRESNKKHIEKLNAENRLLNEELTVDFPEQIKILEELEEKLKQEEEQLKKGKASLEQKIESLKEMEKWDPEKILSEVSKQRKQHL